ncbi:hypothetical protein [Bradyrhizobium sp. CB1015]|uniref:hypothetical protein n=1 Tax=Bradyrhizobium sp. CB1015 TaxID=2976822 RepID=UPI0021AB07FA|nr:hypothetical protein [Bradyrhizobium sp. CB1015]UWU89443.1 hypothetical protein N2604_23395 [Bradyrhizobium sp. CB1015]
MAKDSDPLADAFSTKEPGLFSGLLAEESGFDRRMMWRLGSWGVAAVGAVVVAVMANQAQLGWRRDQVASADLARQADRLQLLTKESQNEARRLAAAIETLNSDRDRLYSRVTVLEQGLDSVTGAIAKQAATPPGAKPQDAAPAPAAPSIAPVASAPAPAGEKPRSEAARDSQKDTPKETLKEPPQSAASVSLVQQNAAMNSALPTIPLVPAKSLMALPDPAASKLMQPESAEKAAEKKAEPAPTAAEIVAAATKAPDTAESESPAIAVQQTRFAIDLGGANSIDGLRALWRSVTKSNPEIAALRPIIMIKEGTTGLGMQLRLGAGPLVNAAAAAKFCASLAESDRHCETTVFDGQRLSMRGSEKTPDKGPEKSQDRVQDRVQDKSSEKNQDAAPQAETAPAPSAKPEKPDKRRRSYSSKRSKREEPAPPPAAQPAPAKPETASASATSTLSSIFRR